MKRELIYPKLSYKITGILFEIHNELGKHCNEKQYGDLFARKLQKGKIGFQREKFLPESFRGENIHRNRVDFIIEEKIIIEFKCKRVIERADYYQVKRYLVSLDKKLGLIVNFHEKYLKPRRVLNSNYKH